MGIMISHILLREREKGLGVVSQFLLNLSIYFRIQRVYLLYHNPTRREVCVHLLNRELRISHILLREGKDWV